LSAFASKRWLVFAVLTLALAALTAAGCGDDDDDGGGGGGGGDESAALQKVGKGEGEVNVIAWAGYVEDAPPTRRSTGCPTSRSRAAARST
jgi:putative spermidine/putrescine transport system substrate-binding protein